MEYISKENLRRYPFSLESIESLIHKTVSSDFVSLSLEFPLFSLFSDLKVKLEARVKIKAIGYYEIAIVSEEISMTEMDDNFYTNVYKVEETIKKYYDMEINIFPIFGPTLNHTTIECDYPIFLTYLNEETV